MRARKRGLAPLVPRRLCLSSRSAMRAAGRGLDQPQAWLGGWRWGGGGGGGGRACVCNTNPLALALTRVARMEPAGTESLGLSLSLSNCPRHAPTRSQTPSAHPPTHPPRTHLLSEHTQRESPHPPLPTVLPLPSPPVSSTIAPLREPAPAATTTAMASSLPEAEKLLAAFKVREMDRRQASGRAARPSPHAARSKKEKNDRPRSLMLPVLLSPPVRRRKEGLRDRQEDAGPAQGAGWLMGMGKAAWCGACVRGGKKKPLAGGPPLRAARAWDTSHPPLSPLLPLHRSR